MSQNQSIFAPIMSFNLSSRTFGYTCGILAACSYGTNPLMAIPLFSSGMNANSMLFYRYFIAATLLGGYMLLTGKSFRLSRQQIPLMIIFGIMFAASSLLLFESYRFMDVGIASTILFIYPVFVALINTAIYHERLSYTTILSIAMALTGIGLLYDGGDSSGALSTTGIILVAMSALSYAVYMIAVNRTSLRRLSSITLTFYSTGTGLLLYLVLAPLGQPITLPANMLATVCVTGLAIFPTILSLITMAIAIHIIGSTPTAIMGALEPVTALVIGVCLFGEILTPKAITGIILVLGAVTLLVTARKLLDKVQPYLHRHS